MVFGDGGSHPTEAHSPLGGSDQVSSPWPVGVPQPPVWGPAGQFGQQLPSAPEPEAAPPDGDGHRRAVVIGVVVLLVLAIGGAVMLFGRGIVANSDGAGDAVRGYLEALARGDAAGALAFGADQPTSEGLLTDEILHKQIAKMPIADIRILGAYGNDVNGFVHVSAKFGDQTSAATLEVTKNGGRWKLDTAAVRLDFSDEHGNSSDVLTAFGATVASSVVYMFPGWVDWGSSNANVVVTGKPLLLDSLRSYVSVSGLADFSLSDASRAAIISAVRDRLTSCAQSKMLKPDNCPQLVAGDRAVDGTVVWQAPDASSAEIKMSSLNLETTVSWKGTFTYTVQGTDGSTITGSSAAVLWGEVDVTQSPPTVAWS